MSAAAHFTSQANTGRSVVVTGATRGIGFEIAKSFARAGYYTVIGARHSTKEIETQLRDLGPQVKFVAMDVTKPEDHERLVAAAVEGTGSLDVYINNAGISQWRPVQDINPAFWQMMIEVNLSGTFWGMQAAARAMKNGGSIINVSSLAGKRGSANNSAYCAAKFGVNGLTQSLAKELGPRGIRVNAVCPVYVTTETLIEALRDPRSPAGGQDVETYLSTFASSQAALKRLPQGHEIGSFCLTLSTDASSAVTGQCINVDCGVLPQ